ncbi:MAG: archaeal proteasome endopeptidase complex subunit beta [Desulfurococcales archaeon]|nr:archaeal proteasome endopeptidase complex subunit beta [Desulfurococcales archaeon]
MVIKDNVILAADKRATAGMLVASRRVKKIVKLTDYAAMTLSGLVADAQALTDIIREEAKMYQLETKRRLSVRGIATILSNILFSSKWFPYLVQLLVGGYDEKPRLYTLDPYGSITEESFAATGSGSPVAYGVLEENYRESMSLEEATKIAANAVRAAILRDTGTGDGIDVVVIGRNEYKEIFIPFKT